MLWKNPEPVRDGPILRDGNEIKFTRWHSAERGRIVAHGVSRVLSAATIRSPFQRATEASARTSTARWYSSVKPINMGTSTAAPTNAVIASSTFFRATSCASCEPGLSHTAVPYLTYKLIFGSYSESAHPVQGVVSMGLLLPIGNHFRTGITPN